MSPHSCPKCDASFDSRRGLGVHHSRVHGERLPNRTCEHCGGAFYREHEQAYCSDSCRAEAVSREGSANPNYSGAKETTECAICGDEFEFYPCEKEGIYCPKCVQNADWRDPPRVTGSDNHRWNGGTVELPCAMCGSKVERYPHQQTGEVTLCGRDCHTKWLSESFAGDGHPNWRGGGVGSYGRQWNGVRERALERDDRTCVYCGADASDIGRNPDVHHIVPVRLFVQSPVLIVSDAHTLDNVVSLCPQCHRRAEFGHISRAELRWRAGLPTTSAKGRATN